MKLKIYKVADTHKFNPGALGAYERDLGDEHYLLNLINENKINKNLGIIARKDEVKEITNAEYTDICSKLS